MWNLLKSIFVIFLQMNTCRHNPQVAQELVAGFQAPAPVVNLGSRVYYYKVSGRMNQIGVGVVLGVGVLGKQTESI